MNTMDIMTWVVREAGFGLVAYVLAGVAFAYLIRR